MFHLYGSYIIRDLFRDLYAIFTRSVSLKLQNPGLIHYQRELRPTLQFDQPPSPVFLGIGMITNTGFICTDHTSCSYKASEFLYFEDYLSFLFRHSSRVTVV